MEGGAMVDEVVIYGRGVASLVVSDIENTCYPLCLPECSCQADQVLVEIRHIIRHGFDGIAFGIEGDEDRLDVRLLVGAQKVIG